MDKFVLHVDLDRDVAGRLAARTGRPVIANAPDIESDGTVKARYTNGQSKALARVQLADFRNLNGLQPIGANEWKATNASGEPLPLGAPGSGVYGLLQSGALEESNVDLTGELVNMIVAQRTYQANAQTIKTEDQVLQTLVNLR